LELRDTERDPPHRHDDTKPSIADCDPGTSTPPRSHDDVAGNDVIATTTGDWLQQLVDVASMLSRFIGLEYFSDGAAMTKALWFW